MKKVICLIILLSVVCKANSQTLTISFQPKASENQIDSIQATNLTTNQVVKLSGSESLVLVKPSGINPLKDNPEKGYIYPNPSNEDATFCFSTNKSQQVEIRLYNISGQLLTREYQNLAQGTHRFRLKFPAAGIYNLFVLKDNGPASFNAVYTGKMQNSSVSYLGSPSLNSQNTGADLIKSALTGKTLDYKDGDIILYSFFSGKNTTILTDIPTASKTIDVEFVSCIDKDNRSYKAVKIGTQWWMAENLAYLPAVSPPLKESDTDRYYYVYGYNGTDVAAAKATSNFKTYGVLYNWFAALVNYPPGWHLPSDAEWIQLEMALGMTKAQADSAGGWYSAWRGTNQGTQMKTTTGWYKDGNGTNSSGFSGLPGGIRDGNGTFTDITILGYWWSNTWMSMTVSATFRELHYNTTDPGRACQKQDYGFSVRCVKD